MLFSLVARRSVPASATMMATASRPLSTQTLAQVQDLESTLKNLRWNHSKDTVHEIRDLMNESKTNHAIKVPDAALEDQVCTRMQDIRSKLQDGDRDAVHAEIFGLKRLVKSQLYGQA